MVKLGDATRDPYTIAKQLADQGLQVFPAKYRDKFPLVKWQQYQNERATHMLETWFRNRGNLNFWVLTGRLSGFVVVDADSEDGDKWWREQLGDELMDQTTRTISAKGTHYWFKIPDEWNRDKAIPSWACHPGEGDGHQISFDFRADDMGIIVPPSMHESGHIYRWEGPPLRQAQAAPLPMIDGTIRRNAPVATGDPSGTVAGAGGQTRSLLSRLLASPPGGEGSGRNDWLARVAGHYAKTYHLQRDLYDAHCAQANASMGLPLDDKEFTKTIDSVWKGEHQRNTHRTLDAKCGYLMSGGTNILTQVIVRRGEDKDYELQEYADFDLQAKGVMTDESDRRTYWCELVRKHRATGDTEKLDIVLRAEVLGDDRALRKFFASYGATILPPDNMTPKSGSPGLRIQRYLESQNPQVVRILPCLGWSESALPSGDGAFITHDHAITATDVFGIRDVVARADPRLKSGGTAPYEYGFEQNEVIAQQVLAEVLTFHDETVCSVFGAWWAACLLKPQIEVDTALFPFVALEAPSESGKTNGFFAMMIQLNGNMRGEVQPTKAALRDMAASHRSGISWIDDLDDPAYLLELLRASTSAGTLTKMGEDRESVKNTQIVSPIVISGEALGLGTQKALMDRAIMLKAPSPTRRRSRHDPSRPQWDDILDMRAEYRQGLHVLSGWYVQHALGEVEQVLQAVREGRRGGTGRNADKVAVLRAGARLLDSLVGHEDAWAGTGEHATRVEAWLHEGMVDEAGVAGASAENALTLEILPWALRKWEFPDKAYAGGGPDRMATPVIVRKMSQIDGKMLFGEETEVLFHPALLAEAWRHEFHGAIEKRTSTEQALKDQALALGSKAVRVKIANSGGRLSYYWRLTGPVAVSVVERAIGK